MVNRAAILLRYKQPAVRWIKEADPNPGETPISLQNVNQERTVYLISVEDADTPADLQRWVKKNYVALMENELAGWYSDAALWPKVTWKLFQNWFTVECHTVLVDTVGTPIYDDDL